MHCDPMMRSRKSALELSCDATSTFQPTSGPMVLLLRLRAYAFDEDGCDEDNDVTFLPHHHRDESANPSCSVFNKLYNLNFLNLCDLDEDLVT